MKLLSVLCVALWLAVAGLPAQNLGLFSTFVGSAPSTAGQVDFLPFGASTLSKNGDSGPLHAGGPGQVGPITGLVCTRFGDDLHVIYNGDPVGVIKGAFQVNPWLFAGSTEDPSGKTVGHWAR